jgi:hypothetical protein
MTTENNLNGIQKPRFVPRISAPQRRESATLSWQWLEEHAHEYRGQWVALVGSTLVDHDVDLKVMVERLDARGLSQDALLSKVTATGWW